MKVKENPYRNKNIIPTYTFYSAAVWPALINQYGFYFLGEKNWIVTATLLVIGCVSLFTSDEYKLIKLDEATRRNVLTFYGVVCTLSFILGVIGALPILVLTSFSSLLWAKYLLSRYRKISGEEPETN